MRAIENKLSLSTALRRLYGHDIRASALSPTWRHIYAENVYKCFLESPCVVPFLKIYSNGTL